MIILDTNVVSELMRPKPHEGVTNWIRIHSDQNLTLSVIAIAEIHQGITRLPKEKKRDTLWKNFNAFTSHAFKGRILSFDELAARHYGEVSALREKAGKSADPVDMMIAAIAKANKAIIATRNIKDFEECEITLVNPWEN